MLFFFFFFEVMIWNLFLRGGIGIFKLFVELNRELKLFTLDPSPFIFKVNKTIVRKTDFGW